jgi:tetratricopeptide (TPR) repeat protein
MKSSRVTPVVLMLWPHLPDDRTSTPGWQEEISARWSGEIVPSEILEVLASSIRAEGVERMCMLSIVRRLRVCAGVVKREVRPSSRPRAADDGKRSMAEWADLICDCDDRMASLLQAPHQDPRAKAAILLQRGWGHQQLGQLSLAERCYRAAVGCFRELQPVDYEGIARALQKLATVHVEKGEHDKALLLQEATLRIHRNVLPPDDPTLAAYLTALARLYEARKDFSKAQPLYEEALQISRKHCPTDHPDLAQLIAGLACVYMGRKQLDKAQVLHEEALAMRRRALARNHPHIISSLSFLAMVHYSKGDYASALPLYEEALVRCPKPGLRFCAAC